MKTTNYQKFRTRNRVVRALIEAFYGEVLWRIERTAPASLLDAGCGEGETLRRLGDKLPQATSAIDLNADCVAFCQSHFPTVDVREADITRLPHADKSHDMVVSLEVLEHLPDPRAAVRECLRVARRGVLFSVPHEPWFRLGSLARGKYLAGLGNHPEHVNHWNERSFGRFLRQEAPRVWTWRSLPWLLAYVDLARTSHQPSAASASHPHGSGASARSSTLICDNTSAPDSHRRDSACMGASHSRDEVGEICGLEEPRK